MTNTGETIPGRPSREDRQEAIDLLLQPVEGVPFASFRNSGFFLTLLASLAGKITTPPVPAFLITGPRGVLGKSYVARMAAYMVTGQAPPAVSWPAGRRGVHNDELHKLLFAIAYSQPQVILFEGLATGSKLTSPVLDEVLATGVITRKPRGSRADVTLPVRCPLIFTGTDITPTGETAKYFQVIRLVDNQGGAPKKPYKHTEKEWFAWADENRPRILTAISTLWLAHTLGVEGD